MCQLNSSIAGSYQTPQAYRKRFHINAVQVNNVESLNSHFFVLSGILLRLFAVKPSGAYIYVSDVPSQEEILFEMYDFT